MRAFVQLDGNNSVYHYRQGKEQTGAANEMEVTGRLDGPWDGKIYNAQQDSFSVAPPEPTKAVLPVYPFDQPAAEATTERVMDALKNIDKRLRKAGI